MPCNPSVHSKHSSLDSTSVVPPGAFSVAFGNPANAGYLYGLTMLVDLRIQAARNQTEAYPQETSDRLVETIGSQTAEPLFTKVKESLHVRVETLTPLQFLDGATTFLDSIGMNGYTEISVNEQSIQPPDSNKLGLQEAVDLCRGTLKKEDSAVRTIEISSHGKNDDFSLLLNFFYSRKHRYDEAPIELEVRAMSNELGPKQGESFQDYRARMNAIDTDVHKRTSLYEAIEAEKKALYSDFGHHLTEAFPGVRLQLYESVAPGEN